MHTREGSVAIKLHTGLRGVAIKLAHQREECGNQVAHWTERGEAIKLAHQTEWRQQAASAVCCGDINAIPELSESLRHPISQED